MTDRDTFAAAALTGLLARPDVDADPLEYHFACEDAYKWADAMLRERDKTNHDAAPAARASVESVVPQPTTQGDSDRTDQAAPQPCEGTGDTPAPHATPPQGSVPSEGSVPDSRTENKPAAWAVTIGPSAEVDVYEAFAAHQIDEAKALAEKCLFGKAGPLPLRPLFFAPALTDEEREAVKLAADFLEDEFYGCSDKCAAEHNAVATLRKLLERMA